MSKNTGQKYFPKGTADGCKPARQTNGNHNTLRPTSQSPRRWSDAVKHREKAVEECLNRQADVSSYTRLLPLLMSRQLLLLFLLLLLNTTTTATTTACIQKGFKAQALEGDQRARKNDSSDYYSKTAKLREAFMKLWGLSANKVTDDF